MDNLDELLGKLLEWLEATEPFAIEQVPIVLKEILMWKTAEAVGVILIGFIFIAVYLLVLANAKKPLLEDECTAVGLFTIVGGIACIPATVMPLGCGFRLLQIYFAPRVYLIEYLRSLV